MFTFRAFIEYRGAFINTPKLHCIKIKFWITTLRTWLFNNDMLIHILTRISICILDIVNPCWTLLWCTCGVNWRYWMLMKLALKWAKCAFNTVVSGRIKDRPAVGTERHESCRRDYCLCSGAMRNDEKIGKIPYMYSDIYRTVFGFSGLDRRLVPNDRLSTL